MVESKIRKAAVLAVFLMVLFMFLKVRPAQVIWSEAQDEITQKQRNYTRNITKEELDDFIKLWPQFVEMDFNDDLIISYHIDAPSKFLDWKTKLWLGYHKWDSNRFFYVEQRINSILNTIHNQKEAKEVLKLLKNYNKDVSPERMPIQHRILENKEFSATEMALVLSQQDLLEKLLK